VKVRKATQSARAAFINAMHDFDWTAFLSPFDSVDDVTDMFHKCVLHFYDSFFPHRTIRIRSQEPPWMKISLKLLINERDQAFANKQHTKFLRLREKVYSQTKHLKSVYLRHAISSGDIRKLWNAVSTLCKRHKNSSSSCPFSPGDFNEYFSSNFQSCETVLSSHSLDQLPRQSLCVSIAQVESLLRHVKLTSPGPDGVPAWVFRECSVVFAPVISALFNRIFRDGYVHSSLKVADICPIPKCTMPSQVSDFRPISKLPIVAKIFEKIVCSNFLLPCIRDKVSANQFAYIPGPGKGTVMALTSIYLHILRFLDSQSGCVRVALVDLSKAFDRLTHKSIIEACCDFRLSRDLVALLVSYLSDRFQRVTVGGLSSSFSRMTSGVPQGSIIGPILFSLVVNSLSPVCKNSKFLKYADDLTVLHFLRDDSDDDLQTEINNIVSWTDDHNLSINVSKSVVMDICTKKSLSCKSVFLMSSPLVSVSTCKILGCIFSNDMKWNAFVDFIVKKASKRLYLIISLKRSDCPDELLFRAYCAFIRPILLYAFPAVCNMPSYLSGKVCKLENRVLRIIKSDTNFPCFYSVADKMCLKLIQQISELSDHPLRSFFVCRHDVPVLRRTRSLGMPKVKTKRFASSLVKYCK